MYIFFLILLILYFAIYPLIIKAWRRKTPLDLNLLTENEKIRFWIKNMTFIWGITLVILVLCLFAGIGLYDIGFREIRLSQNIWFTSITLALCGLFVVILICKMIADLVSPKYRAKQKEELANDTLNKVQISTFPRSKRERITHIFTSITAGVCEEIIFRGFLIFLLQAAFPNMPISLVLVISSIIFGCGHAYQGFLGGVTRTTITGIILGSLFLVTNSLILPMLLHFIFNISDMFSLAEDIK